MSLRNRNTLVSCAPNNRIRVIIKRYIIKCSAHTNGYCGTRCHNNHDSAKKAAAAVVAGITANAQIVESVVVAEE